MTEEQFVAALYNETGFAYESERLERHVPAEYEMTRRVLRRYVPDGSVVADVGVGVGHYAEDLARRGCRLHLVDISSRLLATACQRVGPQVFSALETSATNLRHLADGSCDAVLLLGPLYHLRTLEERQQAVREAARILRPGGIFCGAAINRLAYLRDALKDSAHRVLKDRDFYQQFLQDGKLDPEHAPPIGYAHLTTVAEFRTLCSSVFQELALLGAEAFATSVQTRLLDLTPEAKEAWLDLMEATASTPEGLGAADHFLFVGEKSRSAI
ncbi:MAG: class I SAM-dependent methyltransferase [Candidatus Xenobia bacterium]